LQLLLTIIQRTSETSDAVIKLIPTPPQNDQKKHTSLSSISSEWLKTRSQQVKRMLPGGLHISGIYTVKNDDGNIVC
jgi:hypothetical protein